MTGKASLSATNLAVHHHHNCDLYLHNVYHQPEPTTNSSKEAPELTDARFRRGIDWEKSLFTWLDRQNLLLTVPSGPMDAALLFENIQADDRDHFFIAGVSFLPPQEKLDERFRAAEKKSVRFGLAKPDLLEIRRTKDGIKWKVIDAKVSSRVKIYFYTMCLAYILPHDLFSPEGSAAVWLPPPEGFDKFTPSLDCLKSIDTALLSSSLDHFLFEKLPDIISASLEETKWHYNPRCRGCPYENDCKTRAISEGDLGSMPNISLEDAKMLRGLLRASFESTDTIVQIPPPTDIEDLHKLIAEPDKLDKLASQFPSMIKRSKRILALPEKSRQRTSPVVEAARSRSPQVKLQRNLALPRHEDIAVIMSLVSDYSSASPSIEHYTIDVVSRERLPIPATTLRGPGSDLVPTLSLLISAIITVQTASSPSLTTQFYVWSASEHSALQAHLITTALTSSAHDHEVRVCIGALAQGATLLHTAYQPVLLSGALLSFLANSQRTKAEHIAYLERMGLSTEGSSAELRQRVDEEIQKFQTEGRRVPAASTDRGELGQLPRVVVLQREIAHLVALPVPGYWDLAECASALLPKDSPTVLCPTSEEIFTNYRQDTQALDDCLVKRNASIYAVLQDVRNRVARSGNDLLVNTAKILSSKFMDLCRQEHIRKLFFVQQFEVLTRLSELWRARIEGCPDAPVLEYITPRLGARGMEHVFRLVSGTLDMPAADKGISMYDKIIVSDEDSDSSDDIPVEALFDDLAVSGLVFPLNKSTRPKWAALHPDVQNKLWVASLQNMVVDGNSTKVVIQAWGSLGVKFLTGCKYRISPRLVDFNTSKALAVLLEMDLRWGSAVPESDGAIQEGHRHVPLLQMIADPSSFGTNARAEDLLKTESVIQRLFRELNDLGTDAAGSLILKSSQHRAAQRILSNRLSVIWGPPGTGKTYTIALSLLRLIDAQCRLGNTDRKIIFVTAMTHAAIDAVRKGLLYLIDCYRAIDSLPTAWLDRVRVEQVLAGRTHPGPQQSSSLVHIYAGTTYQLYNFTKQRPSIQVDCVVVDEAGQLGLSSIALILRALSATGQIIVAGDSEQLAPILSAQYPQLTGRPLFGSVLDCLMYKTQVPQKPRIEEPFDSQASTSTDNNETTSNVVQLTENFRLNPDLGEFVSTIYSRAFKPQKVQARQLARNLKLIEGSLDMDHGINASILQSTQAFLLSLSKVMLREPQNVLSPPRHHSATLDATGVDLGDTAPRAVSLSLLKLNADSASAPMEDVAYETHVRGEAEVAAALVASIRRCSPDDDIFVATPHRVQREAVKSALARVVRRAKEQNASEDTLGLENMRIGDGSDDDFDTPATGGKGKVKVDTIERLQGSEAAFVICLFSMPKSSTSPDLGFLLERRRLNVAISRAKTLCVVVTSPNVLRPGVNVLANDDTAKGYTFLRAFEERAWSCEMNVDLDNF
ncbi:hypothetical protein DXG01_004988 [Tephrocybe rancida]|nr:hypothetical protein DXG01_004988 [Tephrocybe rancida]